MTQGQPYNAYQKTSVETSNQKQLIVMLYDGINSFTGKAIKNIDEGDLENAHANLQRTAKILMELLSTLREDRGGHVAGSLKKLYVYCYERIVIANLKKDKEIILEVQGLMNNLGEAWKKIGKAAAANDNLRTAQNIRVTG